MFQSNPQPMWVYDRATLRFLAVNDAAVRQYGYSGVEYLKMTIADIRPMEDVGALRRAVAEPGDDQGRKHSLWRHLTKAGKLLDVEILSHPLPFDGKDGVLLVATNVTARMVAERELALERERLINAQAVTHVGSWETDLRTLHVHWSDETFRIFGLDPATFHPTHESFLTFVHPDDRELVDSEFRTSHEDRDIHTVEHRVLCRDGTVKMAEERWHTFADAKGRPIRAVGTCQDITAQYRSQEAIREQAALLDAVHEAILVKDLDDRIIFWNRGAQRTYGWTAKEALGRTSHDLCRADPGPYAKAREALAREGRWEGEMTQYHKDGRALTVEVRWTLVRDAHGHPKSVCAINTDITERKSLEAQFLRAQRLESLGTLAGGIAHDLNNILTPILASIDLLRDGEADPDRIDTLDTIRGSARRGAAMVQQVLAFARGAEGARVPLDPRTLTRELEGIIKDTFPKGIRLSVTAPEELWTVTGDPTQLQQVLMNLCVNARDAMPAGGRVTITLANITVDHAYASLHREAAPGEYVMFRVSDTGVGIPLEAQDRLFEPFFTTKELGKGTGLGLSTVHSIVRAHHGFVEFHSELGKGTTFKVNLPANVSERPSADPVADPSLPHGEGELILVVDDERGIRSIVQRTLERFGYRVIVAADGTEGIALYTRRRGEIAAVLTDMAMPLMDGPAMMAELRALDPAARIIGSSGLSSEDSIARAKHAGVTTFISKPYTTEALLTTLRSMLHPEG